MTGKDLATLNAQLELVAKILVAWGKRYPKLAANPAITPSDNYVNGFTDGYYHPDPMFCAFCDFSARAESDAESLRLVCEHVAQCEFHPLQQRIRQLEEALEIQQTAGIVTPAVPTPDESNVLKVDSTIWETLAPECHRLGCTIQVFVASLPLTLKHRDGVTGGESNFYVHIRELPDRSDDIWRTYFAPWLEERHASKPASSETPDTVPCTM